MQKQSAKEKLMTSDNKPIVTGKGYYHVSTKKSYPEYIKIETINVKNRTVTYTDGQYPFGKSTTHIRDVFADRETACHEWDTRCQARLKYYNEILKTDKKRILAFPYGKEFSTDYCKQQAFRNAVIRTFGIDVLSADTEHIE